MGTLHERNNVTLLHKGIGPSLFQYRSRPFPVALPDSSRSSVPSDPGRTPKKVVVKCVDRQDANTMFSKRLRERSAQPPPPLRESKQKRSKCDLVTREQLFTNLVHKAAPFPPPSFMPRWNPRHRDRTYCDKVVYQDPWSLPSEERAELKKRTGLRLKSISRQYQYKQGLLPIGKDVLSSSCTCHVEYCDHCSQSYTQRCPLHAQLMDPVEHDCKTELTDFCPFRRNPEDMNLEDITDLTLYVDEVTRRLKQGEIKVAPPFPLRFQKGYKQDSLLSKSAVEADSETNLDPTRRNVATEDRSSQTEPFKVDIDMKGLFKESLTQTEKPARDEPMLMHKRWRKLSYKPFNSGNEVITQVTPCMTMPFDEEATPVARKVAEMMVYQSIQEIQDEMAIIQLRSFRAKDTEKLAELQRTMYFRHMQEKFRLSSYVTEEETLILEQNKESAAAECLEGLLFAQSYLFRFTSNVMESMRQDGFITNQDLNGIQTVLASKFNGDVRRKMVCRLAANQLIDEMIYHAQMDLEMDSFRSHMVDSKYLMPSDLTTKELRDLIELREDTAQLLTKMKESLFSMGYGYNRQGQITRLSDMSEASEDGDLEMFLNALKVAMDLQGNPKYLVDAMGNPLPVDSTYFYHLQLEKGQWDETPNYEVIPGAGPDTGLGELSGDHQQAGQFALEEGDLLEVGNEEEFDNLSFDITKQLHDLTHFLEGGEESFEDDEAESAQVVFRRTTSSDERDDEADRALM